MRTTIRIDDALLKRAKEYGVRSGRSLTRIIEDALRLLLERQDQPRRGRPYRVIPFKGGGRLMPGVDLDDSATLLDLMDEFEPPRR